MRFRKWVAAAGSRLRVGSSSRMTEGSLMSARAMPKRWYMPLENFMTRVSAASSKPVRSSTSSILRGRERRGISSKAAKKSRFSRAESRGKNDLSVETAKPTCRRT